MPTTHGFEVGDKVKVFVAMNEPEIILQVGTRLPLNETIFIEANVVRLDNSDNSFAVKKDGSPYGHTWFFAYDAARLFYPEKIVAAKPVVAIALPREFVCEEKISYRARETVPASVIAAAFDRGEKFARRSRRFWPDDKNLICVDATETLSDGSHVLTKTWYWEKKEEQDYER